MFLLLIWMSMISTDGIVLDDFGYNSNKSPWRIVDDVVMGGRSNGDFIITDQQTGLYQGDVSLENNGGFSSVRRGITDINLGGKTIVKARVKGDGKAYQFRIKKQRQDRHSYIAHFKTTGDWEEITLKMSEMYPAFRGRTLSYPNYEPGEIAEIAILIGNKKAESFRLEIDWISVE